MSIITHLKLLNEQLIEERDSLKKEKADLEQDIILIIKSIREVWEAADIDPKDFKGSNKLLIISKMLPKLSKKGLVDIAEVKLKELAPLLTKYQHIIRQEYE